MLAGEIKGQDDADICVAVIRNARNSAKDSGRSCFIRTSII